MILLVKICMFAECFCLNDCIFLCCVYIIFVCAAYGRNNKLLLLLYSTSVQNLATLASAVPEI